MASIDREIMTRATRVMVLADLAASEAKEIVESGLPEAKSLVADLDRSSETAHKILGWASSRALDAAKPRTVAPGIVLLKPMPGNDGGGS